jgi:hypothetical protein
MSQDPEEYHVIIEELKPMFNEPEFNLVLDQVASMFSNKTNEQYYLLVSLRSWCLLKK